MSDAVIRATGLTRRFGDTVAVRDATFAVARASIFGLLGPNGSGKTTIIRMLCGVLRPSGGAATVLGVDVGRDPEAVKRRIGYMSQSFSLYADLSVTENIRFYARVYGLDASAMRRREEAVIELTGIGAYRGRIADRLSGGWKQRLALACAMVHEPALLFLDEPTAGIDPVARRELWDLLFRLSHEGVTMFVTTHYMDEAERCSHVGYIYLSRLIAAGRPDELKHAPDVTPAGMRRLEVTCADPTAALARARNTPSIHDATLFGQVLHIVSNDDLSDSDTLAALAPEDPAASVRPIAATLEDAFVALSRAAGARDV